MFMGTWSYRYYGVKPANWLWVNVTGSAKGV